LSLVKIAVKKPISPKANVDAKTVELKVTTWYLRMILPSSDLSFSGNKDNQTDVRGNKQDNDDLVGKRLSFLDGWFEAFFGQVLIDAVDAHCARHRANENHPEKYPSAKPIQSTCRQEEAAAKDGDIQDDAASQFENGHVYLAVP
jgi:hypothetical protein